MYKTIQLKFPNLTEQEVLDWLVNKNILHEVTQEDEEGNPQTKLTETSEVLRAMDVTKFITLEKATYDEEGNILTPAVMATDKHYNLRVRSNYDETELTNYIVTPEPNSPQHTFI